MSKFILVTVMGADNRPWKRLVNTDHILVIDAVRDSVHGQSAILLKSQESYFTADESLTQIYLQLEGTQPHDTTS